MEYKIISRRLDNSGEWRQSLEGEITGSAADVWTTELLDISETDVIVILALRPLDKSAQSYKHMVPHHRVPVKAVIGNT